MEKLLMEVAEDNSLVNQDKFYREFSSLKVSDRKYKSIIDTLIPKIWALFDRNILSKDKMYLYILCQQNIELLDECISWEKTNFHLDLRKAIRRNSSSLFDYSIYTNQHWIYQLLTYDIENFKETPEKSIICNKLLCLQIISLSNSNEFKYQQLKELISNCCSTDMDPFWGSYIKDMEFLIKIIRYSLKKGVSLTDNEIFTLASHNSILETGSHLFNNPEDVKGLYEELTDRNLDYEEDIGHQLKILASYTLLVDFLKLISPQNNRNINVNKIIKEVETQFMQLDDAELQIELLQVMFASIFLKRNFFIKTDTTNNYVCSEKELQAILFTLKVLIRNLRTNIISEKLNMLDKIIMDTTWRLEVIIDSVNPSKRENNLLNYMLAEPEALINLCLKHEHFDRAYEVLKIFNLETTCLAKQIVFTDHLLELKDILHRTVKIREIKSDVPDAVVPNLKLQFDDIIRDFFQEYPVITCPEWEEVIKRNIDIYPFLECYRGNNEFYMNLLDLVITQGETLKDSKVLMEFADQYKVSSLEQDSKFADLVAKLLFLLEDEQENRVALPYLLSTSELYLSNEEYKRHQEFYCKLKDFYEDFCQSLSLEEPGVLNGDHNSHKIFLNIIKYVEDPTSVDYLQKLFNYLKAFSRVFYIEKNTSQVVSKGKNSSYFSLLTFNRSELMGHLLFQKNLKPVEFENYFEKLKLDFLYHVAGNCFPTVNLHAKDKVAKEELYPDNILYAPDMAVIMFVKRRHWLLSILLTEMYQIEGLEWDLEEYRVQTFVNHMRLPRIKKLTPLFKNNEILASLHYEISYQTVHDFVYTEIGRHNFVSSNNAGLATLEKGEEIEEHELKTTNWKQLYDIIDSIPEKQFRNNVDFLYLKDVILVQLVRETFECNHHHYALEIINNGVRVNLLLEHMKCWPPDFCVNFIKREMSKFNCHSKEIVTELKLWLKYIEHSLEVMEVLDVTTWGPMYEMCSFEPKKVLFKFLSSQKIELLLEFLEYHEVSERMLLYINEEFVEMAFNMDINILHVEKILEKLTIERRISVCHGLLNTLNTITHLQFVTNYVLKFSSDEILSNIALSLKILSIGSESEIEHQFLVLLKDPLSIIEIMIMNLELDKLSSVLDIAKCEIEEKNMQLHISVAKVDALLRRYAEKSLDFRVVLAQPQSRLLKTPELKLLESLDTIQPDTELQEFIPPEIVPSKDQWVNNSEVFQCMCCKDVTFSMFNRRHHCRRCGRAVCYTCSLNRMIVPTYGDLLVRVCLDCFKPKIRNTNDPDESNSSIISTVTNYWMLSNDMEHNRIVREEFSFEFTPSVSLCLALMKFHSKNYLYSKFLLEQCDILLKLLIPNQEPVQELDHMLVIRMLKSLAVAAKMSCQETNCERTSEAADILLSQVELLELLAAKSCLHLLYPIRNVYFIDGISLMRLTDKLVEREQWSLALEVTTKFGTDPSGLFVAWGLNYLKAGCFTSAREKFGKYFEKNKPGDIGGSSQSKNPPLVNKIIELLESIKEPIDSSSVEQPEKAQLVLSRLKRLKDIQAGNYYTKSKFLSEQQPKLEETIYNECVYYLDKYGTPLSLVHFHIKYRHFKRALDCLIAKQMPPEVFVEIYIRCLNEGLVVKLQGCMSEIDSTLGVWKNHLMKICCYLDKRNYLNTLYQLQLFMGDYVRATVTCIKFYEENCASFADLLNNISYLKSAVRHLNQAKEQEQWVAVSSVKSEENLEETFEETSITSPLIKTMTSADIEKHTSTILMQIRLTEYFADCEKKGVCPRKVFTDLLSPSVNKDKLPLPTLFGSEEQRKYVAMMCIICGDTLEEGFAYGLKIIKEFKKLKPVKVYKEVGKYFAQKGNFSRIGELVNWIRNCSEPMDSSVDEVCDELLLFAVASLRNSPCSGANVDDLIKLISDKSMKISACIEARKLNSAYCLAAKYKRLVDMKRIIIEAELSNQLDVRKLCQSFITKHSQH